MFLIDHFATLLHAPIQDPSQKWSIAAPYIIRGCKAPDSVGEDHRGHLGRLRGTAEITPVFS